MDLLGLFSPFDFASKVARPWRDFEENQYERLNLERARELVWLQERMMWNGTPVSCVRWPSYLIFDKDGVCRILGHSAYFHQLTLKFRKYQSHSTVVILLSSIHAPA